MLTRAVRAAMLDGELYELVEHNKRYTFEAAIIVASVSVLTAIGTLIGPGEFNGFITSIIVGFLLWFLWAGVTFWIGTNFFDGTGTYGEMLRVLGFAATPMALGIIPWIGIFVGGVWALLAGVVATRHGLDVGWSKAIATTFVGWVVWWLAQLLLGWIL